MDKRSRVVILTGAGLSAASGIPTFRGDEGLYNGFRAEELLSFQTMRSQPELIHNFFDDMRVKLAGIKPNAGHEMIAELATEFGDRVTHITQNFDNLMNDCSYDKTIHLHGVLKMMKSVGNSLVYEDIGYKRYWDGPVEHEALRGFKFRCPKSNSLYRPHVVLFGEEAPEYAKLHKAIKRLRRQDLFVVIGTQGSVIPVAQFASAVPCKKVLNNLHDSQDIPSELFDVNYRASIIQVSDQLTELIRQHLMVN